MTRDDTEYACACTGYIRWATMSFQHPFLDIRHEIVISREWWPFWVAQLIDKQCPLRQQWLVMRGLWGAWKEEEVPLDWVSSPTSPRSSNTSFPVSVDSPPPPSLLRARLNSPQQHPMQSQSRSNITHCYSNSRIPTTTQVGCRLSVAARFRFFTSFTVVLSVFFPWWLSELYSD